MNFELINLYPPKTNIKNLIINCLSKSTKQLPAWYLYDQKGSLLFEEICKQPEYTLTRTETLLIEKEIKTISKSLGLGVIVEFGAGNSQKILPLLKTSYIKGYVALDICIDSLYKSLNTLNSQFPHIPMLGICCDLNRIEKLPDHKLLENNRLLGFFPGSSLGNYDSKGAVNLLVQFRKLLNNGPLLIGLDQPKSSNQIEAAYNDAAGFSKAFAENLLHRLNRELEGTLNIQKFNYEATWQPEKSRVQMALLSKCTQVVKIAGKQWTFTSGEPLITEFSIKYTPENALELFSQAGWVGIDRWHDPNEEFSLHLLKPKSMN